MSRAVRQMAHGFAVQPCPGPKRGVLLDAAGHEHDHGHGSGNGHAHAPWRMGVSAVSWHAAVASLLLLGLPGTSVVEGGGGAQAPAK